MRCLNPRRGRDEAQPRANSGSELLGAAGGVAILRGPPNLEVHTFESAGEEFAIFEFTVPPIELPGELTNAEKLVVASILDGKSNREIASEHGKTPRTVQNQIGNIFRKLGLKNRWDLIRRCCSAPAAEDARPRASERHRTDDGVNVQQLPDGSVLYYNHRGALQIYGLGNGVSLHVTSGVLESEFAPYVTADTERQIRAHGRCITMVDALDGVLMTTGFRDRITDWLRQNRSPSSGHLLTESKLVEMAINAVNLTLRSNVLRAYSDPEEWEAVGRREVASFKRRPLALPTDLARALERWRASNKGASRKK
jgi:DNA-binding CsgD family transcriptional regulator